MSIVIKDMKMPQNCEECDVKAVCKKYWKLIREQHTRPSWCPLIEIVHCKDCRWGREVCGNIECSVDMNVPVEYHGYDWYCPNGERRVDEHTD